jgi:hypothetical protein
MDLLFFLDCEDFFTDETMDAEKWWAEELAARDVCASFNIVGELLRKLNRENRRDVIRAYSRHEINYHSMYHSLWPTHPVALEGLEFKDQIAWVLKREAPGYSELVATFGRVPVNYCSPGDSWTPATLIAMASMGIKTFGAYRFGKTTQGPVWYCGLLCFSLELGLDGFFDKGKTGFDEFKTVFLSKKGEILRDGGGIMTLYTHPTRLVTSAFWDRQFYKGARPAKVVPAPLRSRAQIRMAKDTARRMMDFIHSQRDLRISNYGEQWKKYSRNRLDLPVLLEMADLAPGEEHRLIGKKGPGFIKPDAVDSFTYRWSIYPKKFKGKKLISQAKKLLWTTRKAECAD